MKESYITKLLKNELFIDGDYVKALTREFVMMDHDAHSYQKKLQHFRKKCNFNPNILSLSIMLDNYISAVSFSGHEIYFIKDTPSNPLSNIINDEDSHEDMVFMFESFNMKNALGHGDTLLDIMSEFDIKIDTDEEIDVHCPYCGGSGYVPYGFGEETHCDECGGDGIITVQNPGYGEITNTKQLKRLDDRLLNISDSIYTDMNKYLKDMFSNKNNQQTLCEMDEINPVLLRNAGILNEEVLEKYRNTIELYDIGIL